jgi:Phage integrase, N-terminal SAM-like domain
MWSPRTLNPGALAPKAQTDTYIVPALIAAAGDPAAWRYIEFFTANIRNSNTRRAYARACARFLAWCEGRGMTLIGIRAHDVGAYIEAMQDAAAPSIKQQLAAVRMLFDWLMVGQVMPNNPAAAVRGPKHVDLRKSKYSVSSYLRRLKGSVMKTISCWQRLPLSRPSSTPLMFNTNPTRSTGTTTRLHTSLKFHLTKSNRIPKRA